MLTRNVQRSCDMYKGLEFLEGLKGPTIHKTIVTMVGCIILRAYGFATATCLTDMLC